MTHRRWLRVQDKKCFDDGMYNTMIQKRTKKRGIGITANVERVCRQSTIEMLNSCLGRQFNGNASALRRLSIPAVKGQFIPANPNNISTPGYLPLPSQCMVNIRMTPGVDVTKHLIAFDLPNDARAFGMIVSAWTLQPIPNFVF